MLSASSDDEICFLASVLELNKNHVNCGIGSIQCHLYQEGNTAVSVVGDDRIWILPYVLLGCSAANQHVFLLTYIPSKERREEINIINN